MEKSNTKQKRLWTYADRKKKKRKRNENISSSKPYQHIIGLNNTHSANKTALSSHSFVAVAISICVSLNPGTVCNSAACMHAVLTNLGLI